MPNMRDARHKFSFDGGDKLTSIGATFFVSYLYHLYVDTSHRNWDLVKTQQTRISTINNSESYYLSWLLHIKNMSDANLNRNSLGLEGQTIKKMALLVLEKL